MRFTNTLGQDKENELLLNSLADRKAEYGPDQLTVLNDAAFAVAQSTISAWPGYAPTPLVSLNTLAAKAQVAEIFIKMKVRVLGWAVLRHWVVPMLCHNC